MIRIGQLIAAAGIGCLILPTGTQLLQIGMILLGFGLAPIYPSLLHATPKQFGEEKTQIMMGVQMAFAYAGSILMPPLLGWIAEAVTIRSYPVYLLGLLVTMFFMVENVNVRMRRK